MANRLYYNTVAPLLHKTLIDLMKIEQLKQFVLVGGTSLSLQVGHRESVDIDMFTDAEYNTIDFESIESYLRSKYKYVDSFGSGVISFGKSFYIGESADNFVKLDLFYTDNFIRPSLLVDDIRLANIDDIVAMKVDVIARKGRKKDFWDLHELFDRYSIEKMIELHKERYPYSHNKVEILENFIAFEDADDDLDPICMRGRHWEVVKLDFIDAVKDFRDKRRT